MTTLEERERVESDYEWFRYSKFALPFLIFNLLLAVTVFCLSVWYGGLNVKHINRGMPRQIEIPAGIDSNEAGVPKYNRSMRIATFIIGFVALAGILLTMYLKPAVGARKGAYFGLGFLLIVSAILAGISGALDAGNVNDAVWCRSRERGTVPSVPLEDNCYSMDKLLVATTVVEFVFCVVGILTALYLMVTAATSFKAPKEDEPYAPPKGASKTTRQALLLLLFFCLVLLVLLATFTIILHEGRDVRFPDEIYYVRDYNNPQPGWPVKNTRLRLSVSTIVILTTLLNLIPFRSRVIAYILGLIYLLCSPLALVAFAMDVKEVDTARALSCPGEWKCYFHAFIATCVFDFFLAMFLAFYVIFEFVARLLMECRHCSRNYAVFEIRKHEESECSSRPVRCEVCSKSVSAKHFVYEHRFDCGVESRQCEQCGGEVAEWDFHNHQAECPVWPVKCHMCNLAFCRKDLALHAAACAQQPSSCEACGQTFRGSDISAHMEMCSEVQVACTRCGENFARFQEKSHRCQ
eukprot:NODE_854_length_1859_cov_223.465746_g768_i0.p1 GENE.NODE_854_length_1859_cov_223.465746_g768_i0~~NODE_854_length_1859_cov_223.465746_g768_i0.p1  ORF type:complete len:577 (+),score=88.89 NODE_854_length_1859_cov_223.465746_g768_i0:167-1732(+)